MNPQRPTSKQYFLFLNIMFSMIVIGQVIFLGIIVGVYQSVRESLTEPVGSTMMLIISGTVLAFAILGAQKLTQAKINEAKQLEELGEKANAYRATLMFKYVILEIPVMVSIVLYLITPDMMLLLFAAIGLGYALLHRPTKEKMISELELNREEQKIINNPDAIIE